MKIIVGLGNPEAKYQNTRHNLGFMIVEEWARAHKINFSNQLKFKSQIAPSRDYLLAKPQTYMNQSGQAVKKIVSEYAETANDLLVVYDDLDLELGSIKLRHGGSSGGHLGLESIIQAIGPKFWRLRIGIGRDSAVKPEVFVLQKFGAGENLRLSQVLVTAVELVDKFLTQHALEPESITINKN